MIPGMRGMSPKKIQQMMKQMGIDVEEFRRLLEEGRKRTGQP